MRVCKALLEDDEEWDEAEAVRLVEGAWKEDSRGTERLTRTMFNDSLFEVCKFAAEALSLAAAAASASVSGSASDSASASAATLSSASAATACRLTLTPTRIIMP